MKFKNVIPLTVIACIGAIVLICVCNYTYKSTKAVLQEKAKRAFIKAVDEELASRDIKGPYISTTKIQKSHIAAELPDSVSIENETGKHWYKFDKEKHRKNITPDVRIRVIHTCTLGKTPLSSDSLNALWRKYLLESNIAMESALCVSVTDFNGNIKSHRTLHTEWCKPSHLVFTIYVGYANEVEVKAYLKSSVWEALSKYILLCLLFYIIYIYGAYRLYKVVEGKIRAMRQEKTIIVKQKEIVEVPVIKVVKEMGDTPIHSYMLHKNMIYYAEHSKIVKDGKEYELSNQNSQLLELFLKNKEEGYILSDDTINEELWAGRGSKDQRHQAINRLRTSLQKVDKTIDIKRQNKGAYQLLL